MTGDRFIFVLAGVRRLDTSPRRSPLQLGLLRSGARVHAASRTSFQRASMSTKEFEVCPPGRANFQIEVQPVPLASYPIADEPAFTFRMSKFRRYI
jgi:hypothetical protein